MFSCPPATRWKPERLAENLRSLTNSSAPDFLSVAAVRRCFEPFSGGEGDAYLPPLVQGWIQTGMQTHLSQLATTADFIRLFSRAYFKRRLSNSPFRRVPEEADLLLRLSKGERDGEPSRTRTANLMRRDRGTLSSLFLIELG